MTATTRIWLLAILNTAVLAFALVATATVAPGEPDQTVVGSLALTGTAEVEGPGGTHRLTTGDHDLAAGNRVRILSGGAVMGLPGDGSLELRAGPGARDGSRLEIGPIPTLLDGDALLVAGEQEQVVETGGARLSLVDGAARMFRSTGAIFAVYKGRASLTSGGRTLDGGLPALRQVVVPDAGMLPLAPSPLRVSDPPDPWDRRFLGEAIGLESVLQQRSVGFTTLLPGVEADIFFFQAVFPGLLMEPAFDQALVDRQDRPVGETLVGAAIALVGERGDFAGRWQEVFELREEGAGWGIIALDQLAPRAALLATLDEAVARSPLLFGSPSPGPVFQPVRPPAQVSPAPPSAPAPVRPSQSPTRVAPPPPPPPPRPAGPVPSPPGGDGVSDPVVDPVTDLLDGVLDGLGGVTDGLL
ncbi:hypothetical protein BH24ACT1_BH24ACT1_12980 [soil metagenome]